MKTCMVPDCGGPRADDKLMCWECWCRVPVPLQQAVYRTHRQYTRVQRRSVPRGVFEKAKAAFQRAARAAIDAAQPKQAAG